MASFDESQWTTLLQLARAGERGASDELLRRTSLRLETLARRMLRDYPVVRRWEQTDDVLQEALIRLDRSLRKAAPSDARHFLRLAATQIRRTLIDLARKHLGPNGIAARYESAILEPGGSFDDSQRFVDASEPQSIEEWTAFHEAIERLPDEEKEVMQLLWYHELSRSETAELLGVCDRTVRRRWTSAKLGLAELLSPPVARGSDSAAADRMRPSCSVVVDASTSPQPSRK